AWPLCSHPTTTAIYSRSLHDALPISPEIIAAVQANGELQPVNLPKEYLTSAGSRARQRVVAAGLRAGALINSLKPPKAPLKAEPDRKSTRLNSSHVKISYAVFCLKKK